MPESRIACPDCVLDGNRRGEDDVRKVTDRNRSGLRPFLDCEGAERSRRVAVLRVCPSRSHRQPVVARLFVREEERMREFTVPDRDDVPVFGAVIRKPEDELELGDERVGHGAGNPNWRVGQKGSGDGRVQRDARKEIGRNRDSVPVGWRNRDKDRPLRALRVGLDPYQAVFVIRKPHVGRGKGLYAPDRRGGSRTTRGFLPDAGSGARRSRCPPERARCIRTWGSAPSR